MCLYLCVYVYLSVWMSVHISVFMCFCDQQMEKCFDWFNTDRLWVSYSAMNATQELVTFIIWVFTYLVIYADIQEFFLGVDCRALDHSCQYAVFPADVIGCILFQNLTNLDWQISDEIDPVRWKRTRRSFWSWWAWYLVCAQCTVRHRPRPLLQVNTIDIMNIHDVYGKH